MRFLKSTKRKIYRLINPDTEFSKRIKYRYRVFWEYCDTPIPLIHITEDPKEWEKQMNWQRNLENKLNSRVFAQKFNCKVPSLYWSGRSIEKVNFSNLPNQYVLKPTMGYSSKSVFVMKDGLNLLDGKIYTVEEIKKSVQYKLQSNSSLEYILEEFVSNERGEYVTPTDYKFYMFNGEVGCIQVINRSNVIDGIKFGTTSYYDEEWKQLSKIKTSAFKDGTNEQPPACFEEMLSAARTLSEAYQIFVRVDFYATCKGAIFGEFSPTPSGGNGFTKYGSRLLIEKWDRYCCGLI